MVSKFQDYGKFIGLAVSFIILIMAACGSDAGRNGMDPEFGFVQPPHFPKPTYTFQNNPISENGFKLGKRLFFDPTLSKDGSVACANCHLQSHAFADIALHPFSVGINDQPGIRNAPPLFNLAFQKEFFWDGGVTHLDFVPIQAIESPIEMGESYPNLIARLNRHPEYPRLFKEAFGVEEVTGPYFLHALSQFMLMMVSSESRYDQWSLGKTDALSPIELEGLAIFRAKCETCHKEPLMTDLSYRNNGIQVIIKDIGRQRITEVATDLGKFKVPSLRNIAVTAPYMHNASFKTLAEVLDHYSDGIHDSPTLDPILQKDGKPGISLTKEEKVKILAFLNTLTDEKFLKNPLFFQSSGK